MLDARSRRRDIGEESDYYHFEVSKAVTVLADRGGEVNVGALSNGTLADLLVLDIRPRENIRNSTSIRWVMADGRLYEAETLAQTGNHPAARG